MSKLTVGQRVEVVAGPYFIGARGKLIQVLDPRSHPFARRYDVEMDAAFRTFGATVRCFRVSDLAPSQS